MRNEVDDRSDAFAFSNDEVRLGVSIRQQSCVGRTAGIHSRQDGFLSPMVLSEIDEERSSRFRTFDSVPNRQLPW
jgi:hypothetical protein